MLPKSRGTHTAREKLTKTKKVHRKPLHPTTTTISKPTIILTNAAKMGKEFHTKASPSKASTSLVLAGPRLRKEQIIEFSFKRRIPKRNSMKK